MRTKRLLLVIPALIVVIIAAAWIVWYQTRPVYSKTLTAGGRYVLYLFDMRPANAVRILRDGLVSELARSGALPPGYPKLASDSWANEPYPCFSKEVTALDRYSIQLTEEQGNRIVLPVCPSAKFASFNIYIMPPWPWAKMDYSFKAPLPISIGIIDDQAGYFITSNDQADLIMTALKNVGVKFLPTEW